MDTKEILYEKIVEISERKEKIIKENKILKTQLNEAISKIDSLEKREEIDFIDRLNNILEGIGVDEKTGEIMVIEEKFNEKSQEIMMAKHFIKVIIEKAKSSKPELDPKNIAKEIYKRIK